MCFFYAPIAPPSRQTECFWNGAWPLPGFLLRATPQAKISRRRLHPEKGNFRKLISRLLNLAGTKVGPVMLQEQAWMKTGMTFGLPAFATGRAKQKGRRRIPIGHLTPEHDFNRAHNVSISIDKNKPHGYVIETKNRRNILPYKGLDADLRRFAS